MPSVPRNAEQMKGNQMNLRSQVLRDPEEGELVAPLSGPSYGPFSTARRRWQKPLPAIIADAMANCRAVSARLQRGMYVPNVENRSQYERIFKQLSRSTHEQLAALEAFSEIEWRE